MHSNAITAAGWSIRITPVVTAVVHELRAFARLHQKELYDLLIKCAARSIIKLTADPHYVGGRVGVMAVLHTWGANLSYHLHVHCLVTGGGLSADGHTWLPACQRGLSGSGQGVIKTVSRELS
jgi:hypothetical protein